MMNDRDSKPLTQSQSGSDLRTQRIHDIIRWALIVVTLALTVPFVMLLRPAAIDEPCGYGTMRSFDCLNQPLVRQKETNNGLQLLLVLIALGANEYLAHKKREDKAKSDTGAMKYFEGKPRYQKTIHQGSKRGGGTR